MNYSVVIVAAGSGSRMGLGYNKLLYKLQSGETIIEKTVRVFEEEDTCLQIIVVTSREDIILFQTMFKQRNVMFVEGGNTRQESVGKGLAFVNQSYVMIHDGARPWVSSKCLDTIMTTLETHDACLLMVPVKDTIKEVVDGKVLQTFQRSNLRQAQTPQAFKTSLIKECYAIAEEHNIIATDDAQVVELCSKEIVLEVEGDYENVKVTTMEDIIGK